jgi:hypothetical protein
MKSKYRFGERIRYVMDNMFSKGTGIMILWLGIASLMVIIIAAVIIVMLNISPEGESVLSFIEAFWQSLMRTLDAGSMADDAGWGYRFILLLVTLSGVFLISTFIGLITSGIELRLENLQRGRSKVLEIGHTVILGWNEQVYTIIEELIAAYANQPEGCVVIMGPGDKVEMENLIREHIQHTVNTRIVVRSGDPIDMSSLDILSLNSAKAIIVLSPKGTDTDSEVIKTCLAITKNSQRDGTPYHIIAELHDPNNRQIADVVGGSDIEWLSTGEIVARVIAQTCRQSGLSIVYTDLLDFAGDEIYFFQHPSLTGRTFGETLQLFEQNAVMGVWTNGGKPDLNPPMDLTLEEGDQIFLLAEDDDQIFVDPSGMPPIAEQHIVCVELPENSPEKILLLGWNWRAPLILQELDHYVVPQSSITIVCDQILADQVVKCDPGQFKNLSVSFQYGDTMDRALLDLLPLHTFDNVILLCYSEYLPVQVADAHTLITLLHLRDIVAKNPACHFSITSEMLDIRNRNLAEVARADDFIVSDKLISLFFSQIAEEKALSRVFAELFTSEGSEIYLRPIEYYIELEKPVNFYTVVESAIRRNEIAIGYRQESNLYNPKKNFGFVLNPNKKDSIQFTMGDKIIVIAER